jgi:hypothetical protein
MLRGQRSDRARAVLVTVLAAAAAAVFSVGLAGASAPLVRLSSDPYTNPTSQHMTEVEPDTFAFGSTIIAAFQVGRFFNGGSSNVGWATSTNAGTSWTNGFLPGTTKHATPAGPYDRISDPAVAYDAKHGVWMISTLAMVEVGDLPSGVAVLTSRSLDGGLTWQNPVTVTTAGSPDKNWIVCDNSASSPFYGNCYTEWDDSNANDRIKMSTSSDGGLTWGGAKNTHDRAFGIGGQPVVRSDGVVVVPIDSETESAVVYFTSPNGGERWSATRTIAPLVAHRVAGGLRTPPLPSAEIDRMGRVFVAWQDCRFRAGCSSNDIVFATIELNGDVSDVTRIPIDPVTSTVDHFTPGLAVDPTSAGRRTRLAVTYYYLPVADCGQSCELHIGFVSSSNGGRRWSASSELAGPMLPSWLPITTQGRMYGDYISTSFVGGVALPGIVVANAPSGAIFDVAAYSVANGLVTESEGALIAGELPVRIAVSGHPRATAPLTAR